MEVAAALSARTAMKRVDNAMRKSGTLRQSTRGYRSERSESSRYEKDNSQAVVVSCCVSRTAKKGSTARTCDERAMIREVMMKREMEAEANEWAATHRSTESRHHQR